MEKKLYRSENDKMIGGVCSGLAEYFLIDISLVRIAFVIAVLFGAGILAYIILWIVMPKKPFDPMSSPYHTDYKVYDSANTASSPRQEPFSAQYSPYTAPPKKEGNGKLIAGILFVAFGCYFLLEEFDIMPFWFDLDKLWPLVFIIPGILLLTRSKKENLNMPQEPINPSAPVSNPVAESNPDVTQSTPDLTTDVEDNANDQPKY